MLDSLIIPWEAVLNMLGVPPKAVLPAIISCPSCKRLQATLHQDTRYGTWYFCKSCKAHGHMADLVALKKHISLSDAVDLLVDRKIITSDRPKHEIEKFLSYHGDEELWNNCRSAFALGKGRDILDNAGVHLIGSSCKDSLSQFVGVVDKAVMVEYLHGHKSDDAREIRQSKWDYAVVLAFFDMPHRIASFLLIPNMSSVMTFRVNKNAEPGIMMWDTVENKHSRIAMCLDPILALRMQISHFRLNNASMPVIVLDRKNYTQNHMFRLTTTNKSTIVIGDTISADEIRCARLTDSLIARYHSTTDPAMWFSKVMTTACDWKEAVKQLLYKKTPTEISDYFSIEGITTSEMKQIQDICPYDMAERVAEAIELVPEKHIVFNGKKFRETREGWFVGEEKISDAVLKIDKIVCRGKSRSYAGRVVMGKNSVSFFDDHKKIDKDPFSYMRNTLLLSGHGMPAFNNRWNKHALDIALKISEPKVVHSTGKIGWDRHNYRFVLNGFNICASDDPVTYDSSADTSSASLPAYGIKPTRYIDEHTLEWMRPTYTDDKALGWSIAAAVIANVIAPMLNLEPYAVGLSGARATSLGNKIVKALGCLEVPSSDFGEVTREETEHNWPVLLKKHTAHDFDPMNVWAAQDYHNCLTPVGWWMGTANAINGRWAVIEGRDETYREEVDGQSLATLLLAYLHQLAEAKFVISAWEKMSIKSLHGAVLDNLTGWLTPMASRADILALQAANDLITRGCSNSAVASLFGSLAGRLYTTGAVRFKDHRLAGKDRQCLLFFKNPQRIFIPKTLISSKLEKLGAPRLNFQAVTDALAHVKCLINEHPCMGMSGWNVSEEWFQDAVTRQVEIQRKKESYATVQRNKRKFDAD